MTFSVFTASQIEANTDLVTLSLVPEIPVRLLSLESDWCLHDSGPFESEPFPYWLFAWGSGQALARHILDHPETVAGRTVCDFGAGCGLAGIAAAIAGAARVIATELDPNAALACRLNAKRCGAEIETIVGQSPPWSEINLLLAADVFYHWPDNGALLNADVDSCPALIASPDRREHPANDPIQASALTRLASYKTRTVPALERPDISSVSVYARTPFC